VSALLGQCPGCCLHTKEFDKKSTEAFNLEVQGKRSDFEHTTDLFYALRLHCVQEECQRVLADTDKNILLEINVNTQSPILLHSKIFSRTISMNTKEMSKFMCDHFQLDQISYESLEKTFLRLCGRPRPFFDYFLPELYHDLQKSKPEDQQSLFKQIQKSVNSACFNVRTAYKQVIERDSMSGLKVKCLNAVAFQNGIIVVNDTELKDLVSNHFVQNPQLSMNTDTKIDLKIEPLIWVTCVFQ